MPDTIKDYFAKLAQTAGLDEAGTAGLLKALENEKLAKDLENGYKRQADYSRHMDELAAQRKALEEKTGKWQQWYENATTEFTKAQEERARALAAAKAYEEVYGPLNSNTTTTTTATSTDPNKPNGDYISKKDFEAGQQNLLNRIGESFADVLGLSFQHFQKFGQPLDVRTLAQKAAAVQQQPMSPFSLAYRDMVSEEEKTLNAEADKKKMEQLRKDWEADFRSKHNIPIDTEQKTPHLFFEAQKVAPDKAPSTDAEKMSAFVEGWNEYTPKT